MIQEYLKGGKKMFKSKIELISNFTNTVAFSNNSLTSCSGTLIDIMKDHILITDKNILNENINTKTKKKRKTTK